MASTGFENGVLIAKNVNFDYTAAQPRTGILTANGDLIIGSTANPNIQAKKGQLTSPLGTLSIGYTDPNITIDTKGGGQPIEKIAVDAGITPVGPNASGIITAHGATQAASGHPVQTTGVTATSFDVRVQFSTATNVSLTTNAGLASFDSSRFTVDANGFVSVNGTGIGETITGDSGGALAPTAGNWNVLGRSGSKTVGSGSTLTIKSPKYDDQGGSTTVTLNSGSFATAAITLTLPAAGLLDGDLFEFVCTTAGALVIQAVGAQKIRVGTLLSSAAGTLTSTNTGDSVTLRFRATDGFFYATSVIGTWLVA